jgi:endonuclease YncB( thermonuclease family)
VLTLTALLLAVCSVRASAEPLHVVDGDTLDVAGVRYRLHGIDAPEAGQKCKSAKGGVWACGKAAISALEKLVLDRQVHCDDRGVDDYDRVIAVCIVAGRDVNELMVASGLAWAFRKYSEDYAATEDQARQIGKGIWQAPTQTAWDYRAEKWLVAEQESPDGCPIKGNISRNGKIYHAPWSPWYYKTKVSLEQGERWFCNEAEALKAGWRAPYWGRGIE